MKLTANLALSQLKVNRRRTIWTLVGVVLSTAMIMTVYGLGFGSGMDFVDRLIGDSPFRANYEATIRGLAFGMSVLILSISVVVISNAFRVSSSERIMQFGILKSTGATKKQITQTVIYEGIYLTMIAIPVGVVIGLFMQWIGVEMLNRTIGSIMAEDFYGRWGYDYFARFVWSTTAIFMSVLVSFLTVLISAWLPARKAANVPAINAIRGIGEVKVKNKKVRLSGLIIKVFKLEGALAATFLKRSKRNYRATVVAMSFSIIIFIVAGGFLGQMRLFSDLMWNEGDANVILGFIMNRTVEVPCEEASDDVAWQGEIDEDGVLTREVCWESTDLSEVASSMDEMAYITERLQARLAAGETLLGVGEDSTYYRTTINDTQFTSQMMEVMEEWNMGITRDHDLGVRMIVLDEENYRILSELAGVPIGSNILINQSRFTFQDGRRVEYEQLNFTGQTLTLVNWDEGHIKELVLHGTLY